jgi:hypothetical protein
MANPKHIKDLIPDPKNRRKHTPRNVGMIVDALQKVGSGRSIVIDENNEVLAGNATIEAAGEAGITKLKVIDATGNEIVAVRRTGLTTDQKRDLAIYDNRTGELADWDVEQLLEDADVGVDLSLFFREDELQDLVASVDAPNYDVLHDEALEKQLDEFASGIKRGIVIEFDPKDYEEGFGVIQWWRKRESNFGRVLTDLLQAQKLKVEG